jgi:phage-related protein
MDTFPATPAPSIQSGATVTPRELVAQFGEGYEQSTQDGPMPAQRDWPLQWNNITTTQMKTFTDFFEAHVGQRFLWTALWPYDVEGPKVFRVIGTWDWVYQGANVVNLKATFSQRPAV